MKHQHFDVGTAGFYGAYWACAGGSDCAVIAMIGDDPEDRLARSAAKWLCVLGRKRAHHVACEKGLRPSQLPAGAHGGGHFMAEGQRQP